MKRLVFDVRDWRGRSRDVLLPFLGVGILIASVACGSGSTQPSVTGSPAQSEASGQSPQNDNFGPLTVVEGPGGGPDARGGKGPLHITATCVTMTRENGDTVLLVWQSADVTWDDTSHEITFVRAGGLAGEMPITLRDGITITIGGAPLDNLPVETHLDWLATPQPGCDGERWFVSGVIKE